jgi:putative transposase
MKKSKFSEAQILGILKEQQMGKAVMDICRQHGISAPTFYTWKNKYSGMTDHELHRLRELERENARLRKIVADQTLDIDILRDVISKKL